MAHPIEIAADVVAGGAAISGLLLVYIGALSTSFGSFQAQERRSVIASYQRRAWFGFVGLVFFLTAVALALVGKRQDVECMVTASLVLLLIGLIWVLVVGIFTVLEIK